MAGHHHGEDGQVSSRKLTYEDFLLFPDDGQRHELIDGEHYGAARHEVLTTPLLPGFTRALHGSFSPI